MVALYSLPFLFLAMIPLSAQVGAWASWAIVPGFLIVFVGFDALLGYSPTDQPKAKHLFAYRMVPWLYIPMQLGAITWGAIVAGRETSLAAIFGLAIAMGTVTGVFGILAAHEMIHSRLRVERALGVAMLAGVSYMHFRISHVYGHHRLAATPVDPVTARRGEGVYRFLLRSTIGQFRDTWRYERARVAMRRLPVWRNRMGHYGVIAFAIYGALAASLGWHALVFQAAQSAVAILILELFNYVAHYGMLRRKGDDGRFEPLGPAHSWNAGQRFNNWALFNGGRHSDHHRAPARAYQRLQAISGSPQLPFGYAGAIFLALFPPLWRRVMDPRLPRSSGGAQLLDPAVPDRRQHDGRAA